MGLGYLPIPPSDKEKYLYVNQNKTVLYAFGIVSMISLVVGAMLFSIKIFPFFIIVSVLLSVYLGISYLIGVFGDPFDLKEHIFKTYSINSFPSIDVYLPSCGEDINVIQNTIEHTVNMASNYPGVINIYVLDDSKDEAHNFQLRRISKDFGVKYISRENKGELKKSGNVRNAFSNTDGEFILILDADFVPREDFLNETIPYMDDPSVAIVQTPQYFKITQCQSTIQKGAAYIQELFYRLVQVNRSKWNASICVGTCALYRRSALEPHGGTAKIGFSEDVHTGFQAIKDGYKIKYIPINLSAGLCPDTISSFIIQQYRWATGSLTLLMNKDFWKDDQVKLPTMLRINYLSGMLYYVASGLSVFTSIVPPLLLLTIYPDKIFWYNAVFVIPSFLYGTVMMAFWSKNKFGSYAIVARHISYWAHLFAMYDKIRSSSVPWIPTGKVSKNDVFRRFSMFFTAYFAIVLWILSYYVMYFIEDFDFNFLPGLILVSFNAAIHFLIYKEYHKELAVQ